MRTIEDIHDDFVIAAWGHPEPPLRAIDAAQWRLIQDIPNMLDALKSKDAEIVRLNDRIEHLRGTVADLEAEVAYFENEQ